MLYFQTFYDIIIAKDESMTVKSEKFKDASKNARQQCIVLYHVIEPVNQEQLAQIKSSGYFNPSKSALGGQSNGYYFFTTHQGAKHHIESNQDSWVQSDDKRGYIFECEINLDTVKYPDWKLDYEAMQDFLFDMIERAAHKHAIKINDIEITASGDGKITILDGKKFSKISEFTAGRHSGLVEQVSDFLYSHDNQFRNDYDKLLTDVFLGIGENPELYAVKTANKHKITKITEIEPRPSPTQQNSQIEKFWARYGKRR